MLYKQTCTTGYALDVALKQMQNYRGIIIGNTCTIETGIVVFFQTEALAEQYKQAYARRLGTPEIIPIAHWSLGAIKQHFQAQRPVLVCDQYMRTKSVKTFFNELTYTWIDASLQKPPNDRVMQEISSWRDQLALDMIKGEVSCGLK